MPRWLMFTIFFSIALTIFGGAHWYVYRRLVQAVVPPASWLWSIRIGFIVLAVSYPLSRLLVHGFHLQQANWLIIAASLWMGMLLYAFLLSLTAQLGWGLAGLAHLRPDLSPEMAVKWGRIAALSVGGLILFISAWGFAEARRIRITELEIPIANLPASLDGYTMVQISDVHLGILIGEKKLNHIIDLVRSTKPDAVLITGDLVDEEASDLKALQPILAGLQAPDGVFMVTGNHEYISGIAASVDFVKGAGIRLLRNEVVLLRDSLQLGGIEDPSGFRFGGIKPDIPGVLAALRPGLPSVVMFHQPVKFDQLAAGGVDLVLSGHTHHGQMWPLRYISGLIYPWQNGVYRLGKSLLYVTTGTGTWGPPMRVFAPPEIVRIRLVRK